MFLIFVLGIVLVGVTAALVVRAARLRPAEADVLGQISAYGLTARAEPRAGNPVVTEALNAAAAFLGRIFDGRLPGFREARIREALLAAGYYRLEARRLMGYQILGGVLLPLLWVWFGPNPATPLAVPVGALILAAMGFWLPLLLINHRGRTRLDQIEYELPELVDLLVVTLEAGVSFSGAMQIASERVEGPLGDELRLTLQEQRMGLSVDESLRNMMNRAETPSVRSFVRSILQGEQLGVSTGQIMRNLAGEMRKRRRAAAEERAQKAPVKILFPLIFLIFPAMFVILLGPAAFRFAESFPG